MVMVVIVDEQLLCFFYIVFIHFVQLWMPWMKIIVFKYSVYLVFIYVYVYTFRIVLVDINGYYYVLVTLIYAY